MLHTWKREEPPSRMTSLIHTCKKIHKCGKLQPCFLKLRVRRRVIFSLIRTSRTFPPLCLLKNVLEGCCSNKKTSKLHLLADRLCSPIMVIEEFGQLSYPRCIQFVSLSSAFASFCVWVLTRLICVPEYLSIQTCWCFCWLIRRRGRSRVRTKTSCSWQTSWPTRGNSTRQQSFTNTPAMDPKPWACTLICACLITQRWLFCCFTTISTCTDFTFHQSAWSATCFDAVEHVFCLAMCSLCQIGALHCVLPASSFSVFHLLVYHRDSNIYHLISAHWGLSAMRGGRYSCKIRWAFAFTRILWGGGHLIWARFGCFGCTCVDTLIITVASHSWSGWQPGSCIFVRLYQI